MLNVGGPQSRRRKRLSEVIHSIMLYGAGDPIWSEATRVKAYRGMMEKVQRRISLRVTSAYEAVSLRAIQVIIGTVPIYLQVDERERLHRTRDEQSDGSRIRDL
ncbi:hypothetical protein JTB14_016206 [Gonioctena quinquepunctata]|nr:hypothetical protein JTB14_016206 [Gonioctena quinquepunctata]